MPYDLQWTMLNSDFRWIRSIYFILNFGNSVIFAPIIFIQLGITDLFLHFFYFSLFLFFFHQFRRVTFYSICFFVTVPITKVFCCIMVEIVCHLFPLHLMTMLNIVELKSATNIKYRKKEEEQSRKEEDTIRLLHFQGINML